MVEPQATPEFISDAAVHINGEHGIAKAVDFLANCVQGLNPVQLFAVCEGKARLRRNPKGEIYVEWREEDAQTED